MSSGRALEHEHEERSAAHFVEVRTQLPMHELVERAGRAASDVVVERDELAQVRAVHRVLRASCAHRERRSIRWCALLCSALLWSL